MGFAAYETSTNEGEPVSLFLFSFGAGAADYYAYTNHEENIIFDDGLGGGAKTYVAIPIQHGKITSSGNLDKSSLTINMVEDASITDLFRSQPPSGIVSLIIRQGHVNDPDAQFLVKWSGRVLGFGIDAESNQTNLTCEPIATSLKRNGLRRHYQYACPHALFGDQCKANKLAASHNAVVLSVNGSVINLSPTWTTAELRDRFLGGSAEYLLPDGRKEYRTILKVEASGAITLATAPAGLDPGESVTMVLGCRHTMEDCTSVHNNIQNFGGCPWIPTKNPVGIKNNYY